MPADPRRVKELFAAAADLLPADRPPYLDRECDADLDLRRRVDQLLRAHDQPASALEHPLGVGGDPGTNAYAPGETTVDRPAAPTAAVGDRVGPYKLLEKIGEGGMGDVWVADQLEPIKRRVALKLIKPGMDSRSVLGRFEAERQALAVMDHPNVARVLDAGTTSDGRPYFVMELVKGTPITEFADARKLTPKQRLELFVPVCQAIQHAHLKGIIHRDIKPSNVLVELHDDRPVVKVIDFGVAKAVGQQFTEKTIYTGYGALVGTPTYMAPEQATFNALDVDTRADVYALGVLLYELLAGSPPIEKERLKKAALDEVLRIVRDEEPPRPSHRLSTSQAKATIAATRQSEPAKLSALMKGELDWIVMKALEKDRTRRYETANGFAADIQRYLSGEQVQAVPPSLGYRLRKAYRRNKAAVLAVGVVSLAVLLGFAGTTGGMMWALDAERQATANEGKAVAAEADARQNADIALRAQEQAFADRNDAVAAREQQAADQYLADMQLMPSVFEKGNGTDVNTLLARHLPRPDSADRRGWEWHYWNRQLNSEDRCLQLEGATFPSTARWTATEDGTRVACFAHPSRYTPNSPPVPTLTVWELPSGRRLLTYAFPDWPEKFEPGESVGLNFVAPKFSQDGTRIAVGCGLSRTTAQQSQTTRGPLVAVEVATGKVLLSSTIQGVAFRGSLSFNRDGTRLELASIGLGTQNNQSYIYDLTNPTGEPVRTRAGAFELNPDVRWRLVHPDGKSMVVGRVLPPESVLPVDALAGIAPSADVTGVVELRDLETDAVKRWWPVRNELLTSPVLTADGARMAAWVSSVVQFGGLGVAGRVGTSKDIRPARVKIWETATGKELGEWEPLVSDLNIPTSFLTFSPDGSRLVLDARSGPGRRGDTFRQLVVLSGTTAGVFSELTGYPANQSASFTTSSRDGSRLMKVWDDTLYAWNTNSGELLRTVRTNGPAFRACGATDGGKRLWAVDATGKVREWTLRPPDAMTVEYVAASSFSAGPTISPDGTRIGIVVATGEDVRSSRGFRWEITDTAGKLLHTLTPSKESAAWRTSAGASMLTAFSRNAERACMVYRPPQTYGSNPVTGGPDTNSPNPRGAPELTVWDTATGTVLMHQPLDGVEAFADTTTSPGPVPAVYKQAFAPDGKTVAVSNWLKAMGDDNSVRLFDVDTGRERSPLSLPTGATVAGMTFSPTADRIAAVVVTQDTTERPPTATATLMIWDTASGKRLVAEPLADGERSARQQRSSGNRFAAALAWSPKTDRLAITVTGLTNDLFTLRAARTGKVAATPELPSGRLGAPYRAPSVMAFHPDGSRLVILLTGVSPREAEIRLLDAGSGRSVLTLPLPESHTRSALQNPPRQLMFAADGQRLLLTTDTSRSGIGRTSGNEFLAFRIDASPPPETKK